MSRPAPKITIISTGSELTSGKSIDTNSSWIASELFEMGFQVEKFLVLPDSFEVLKGRITEELFRSEDSLVILTGGLGPTEDDYTLAVICSILNKKPVRFEKAFRRLESIYEKRGPEYVRLLPQVEKQARVPEGSTPLENNVGIAAGFLAESDAKSLIVAMPGVPAEMKAMFKGEAVPLIQRMFSKEKIFYEWRWIWGIGESYFQDKFIENNRKLLADGVTWGVTAKPGYIKVIFHSSSKEKIETLIAKLEMEFSSIVTKDIFQEIHEVLISKKKTLATAESCTGGLIAKKITDAPGASVYFLGSIISYSNEVKTNLLDVAPETLNSFGAVSKETAMEMAVGLEDKIGCDLSVSVTGIAGPGGETETKKVGLCYIGVKEKGAPPIAKEFHFPFTRELFREYASNMALFCLYKRIQTKNL